MRNGKERCGVDVPPATCDFWFVGRLLALRMTTLWERAAIVAFVCAPGGAGGR
jgi:hypothetical protein